MTFSFVSRKLVCKVTIVTPCVQVQAGPRYSLDGTDLVITAANWADMGRCGSGYHIYLDV